MPEALLQRFHDDIVILGEGPDAQVGHWWECDGTKDGCRVEVCVGGSGHSGSGSPPWRGLARSRRFGRHLGACFQGGSTMPLP